MARKPIIRKGRNKGGSAGANQGGASRGAARLEPSHVREARKSSRGKPRKA